MGCSVSQAKTSAIVAPLQTGPLVPEEVLKHDAVPSKSSSVHDTTDKLLLDTGGNDNDNATVKEPERSIPLIAATTTTTIVASTGKVKGRRFTLAGADQQQIVNDFNENDDSDSKGADAEPASNSTDDVPHSSTTDIDSERAEVESAIGSGIEPVLG